MYFASTAIIVSDPNNEAEKDLDTMYDGEEIIFLQDWYHMNGRELQAGLDSNPFIWVGNPQSFAINGGALYLPCLDNTATDPSLCADNCSIENYIKTIEVESDKTYRLRIIGAQILIGVSFAIANHTMAVVEVEGTLCDPFEVSSLDVMPGKFLADTLSECYYCVLRPCLQNILKSIRAKIFSFSHYEPES